MHTRGMWRALTDTAVRRLARVFVPPAMALFVLACSNGSSATKATVPPDVPRLVISRVHFDAPFGAGMDVTQEAGEPCVVGNLVLAGYSSSHGSPFKELRLVRQGDIIAVRTRNTRCSYEVAGNPYTVQERDTSPMTIRPGRTSLTLLADIPGQPHRRLVVTASAAP